MPRSRTTLAAAALAAVLTVPALAQTTPRYAVTPNLDSNNVSILDTVTHTEVARVRVGTRPWEVAMSPDGRFAYVGEDGTSIAINEINLSTRRRTRRVVLPTQNFITELEVSPDGRWLATADIYHGRVHLVDAATFAPRWMIELCQPCSQQFSVVQVHFSNNSQLLYVAVPVAQKLVVIDIVAGTVVKTIPVPLSTGPVTDIRIVDGDDSRVYVVRSGGSSVYEVDVVNGIVQALPLQQGTVDDLEPLPNSRLATSCLAYGGTAVDALEVLDVSSQTSTLATPASESLRGLAYNPSRNEVWGICHGFAGFCVPYNIDVFDATTLTRQAVLTGPDAIWAGVAGGFTPSGGFYYQPLTNNRVLVINTATRAIVTQIQVGQNPRGVYMQGDARPKELQ
ncbi:MAG TPA: hypothetical protein VEG34_15470 [Thermoanaerobaculia bacterium]|nr:hypothetical protein [Thermoanaerobaculia bacterium]